MIASALPPEVAVSLDLLSEQSPGPASRARAAIQVLLGEVASSAWTGVAWEWSTLTGDGFPLEFSFRFGDGGIRYATECAPPETPEPDRLDRAVRLLHRLGMPLPNPGSLAHWRRLQGFGRLRYGAFAGVRHVGGSDRFKLYVELPEGCPPSLVSGAEGFDGAAVMLGHDPESLQTEIYFRCARLSPADLPPLMARVGVSARAPDLIGLIESVWGRPLRQRLPGESVGISLSTSPRGSSAVAVFNYASALCADDLAIRRRLLSVAHQRGWSFSHYERLTRPFTRRQPPVLAHTMLTYSVSAEGPPRLDVGLRPVL